MSKKELVLAIDFDGTIASLNFPEVGTLRENADKVIRKLYDEGHKIIINTCRSGKHEGSVEDFLHYHNIPYHYINSNLPELIVKYGQDCRKISADYYIDDKCLMGLPSWDEIYNLIQEKLFSGRSEQFSCPLPETKGCDRHKINYEEGRWEFCNTCKREWAR